MKMPLTRTLGSTVASLLSLLVCLQPGCASHPRPSSDLQRLQGTWEGVALGDKSGAKYTITITGNSFHFHRDSKFWFATTIALPAGTDPRQLHATIKDAAPGQESSVGKVVVAIYKIENETLTLAARGEGDEETPKSFEATEDNGLTRYELRKVQKKNTEPPKTK